MPSHSTPRWRALGAVVVLLSSASVAAIGVNAIDTSSAGAVPALPTGFQDQIALSGLDLPTAMALSPDGRVFVTEKGGLVKEFDSLTDTTATTVKDLRSLVYNFGDRGLLGIALHPSFPTVPYLYVAYSYDGAIGGAAPTWNDDCPTPPGPSTDGCPTSARVSRFTVSAANVAGPEQVLIHDWCGQFGVHSIGNLEFGPDGSLYAGGGDGASFTNVDYGQFGSPTRNPCGDPPSGVGGIQTAPTAQGGALRAQDLQTAADPTSLDGSIVRVNPDTGAPVGTVGNDTNAKRILAYGFRNPYRFTFRPGTDELWVGDVGWNGWEEIDVVKLSDPKVNFGWPCYEGPLPQPGYQAAGLNLCANLYANPSLVRQAHFRYGNNQQVVPNDGCPTGGQSITGLAFYQRGTTGNYPPEYDGALFFTDYSRRCMYTMFAGPDGVPNPLTIQRFATDIPSLDLQTGPDGDLFYLDIGAGSIHRIRYFGANVPPVAALNASPVGGPLPLTVQYDGRSSTDQNNDVITYAWDLDGDGQYDDSTLPNPSRVYTTAGSITARLRVSDPGGLTATATRLITPGNSPPTLNVTAPVSAFTWAVGDTVSYAATATDPEQGTLPASAFRWTVVIKHCPTPATCHLHPYQDLPGVRSGSFAAPDHEYPSHLELTVTVTDSGGQSVSRTISVQPQTTTLTLQSDPVGLYCSLGAGGSNTPVSGTVIRNSRSSVSAPDQQSGTSFYSFDSWSDGGAQSHEVVVSQPTVLTARLSPLSVNIGSVNVTEANSGSPQVNVPVTLTKPVPEVVTVQWGTGSATAQNGTDYEGRNGTVVFQPGELSKTVQIPIVGDTLAEPTESFKVDLWSVTNVTRGTNATVTINDNDGAPPVIIPGAVSTTEGNSGTKVVNVPVALSRASTQTVSAAWVTVGGTALSGSDYVPTSGTVTFAPGQTSTTVPVTIKGDSVYESNEGFTLWFVNGSNAAIGGLLGLASVLILNDDAAAPPVVSGAAMTVPEGQSGTQTVVVPVVLSGTTAASVTVQWGTSPDSAQNGTDYHGRSGTLTFAPGETAKTVSVPVVGDTVAEPTEAFAITWWSVTNGVKGGSAWVTLTDDDGSPPVIVPGTASVTEGNTGTKVVNVPVALQGSSPYSVRAKWTTFGGTAAAGTDYVTGLGTVTFSPGQSSATIPITVRADTINESNETVYVLFYNGSNGAIGGFLGLAAVTIIDDD